MTESYYAGVYWGRRQESAEECARRAELFFRLLAQCHPSYSHWYEQQDSEDTEARLQFEPSRETFMHFFGKEEYRSDGGGFRFGAWTGHAEQDQGGMVLIFCGAHAEGSSNHLILYFPEETAGSERMLTSPVLAGVMRAMALAWEPDWGVIVSGDFRDSIAEQGAAGTFVGWMTYFSRQRGELPGLPKPVRVEPVDDKGSLLVLTPDRPGPSNPEHLALGRRVQALLKERGLLERVVEPRTPYPA
ncbi:immunity 52 family protein [Archangium violaceum]|uniref:immunity 52 family protein n=1 Tax=Archangium violaceum TaxID=83451 RepID=UPI00194E20AF|nr:immunity 52 family protein [Archangium violaceum]QRN96071.1 immunity 52 family protein [Archangium violaceum]